MLPTWLFKKGGAPKEAHRSQHSSSWTSSHQQRGRLGEDGDLPRGHTIKWQSWDRILDRWLSSAFSPHCLSRASTSLCSALSWQTEQDRCVPPLQVWVLARHCWSISDQARFQAAWQGPGILVTLPGYQSWPAPVRKWHWCINLSPLPCVEGRSRLGHPCGRSFPAPDSPNKECDLGLGLWAQITGKLLARKGCVLSPKIERSGFFISTLFSC